MQGSDIYPVFACANGSRPAAAASNLFCHWLFLGYACYFIGSLFDQAGQKNSIRLDCAFILAAGVNCVCAKGVRCYLIFVIIYVKGQ